MTGQFVCKVCGKQVKKKKRTRAHRNQKCRLSCDGIQRDLGGFPLDPAIRLNYKRELIARRLARGQKPKAIPNDFLASQSWRELRYRVLKTQGRKCACCGSFTGPFHVDHIKPRSLYPELALTESNLQVLCEACNLGKSNLDETDWRSA